MTLIPEGVPSRPRRRSSVHLSVPRTRGVPTAVAERVFCSTGMFHSTGTRRFEGVPPWRVGSYGCSTPDDFSPLSGVFRSRHLIWVFHTPRSRVFHWGDSFAKPSMGVPVQECVVAFHISRQTRPRTLEEVRGRGASTGQLAACGPPVIWRAASSVFTNVRSVAKSVCTAANVVRRAAMSTCAAL